MIASQKKDVNGSKEKVVLGLGPTEFVPQYQASISVLRSPAQQDAGFLACRGKIDEKK